MSKYRSELITADCELCDETYWCNPGSNLVCELCGARLIVRPPVDEKEVVRTAAWYCMSELVRRQVEFRERYQPGLFDNQLITEARP